MSDSVRPHRRQPTRLPPPWDSPGKNTGVGCHFLLQCIKVKSESAIKKQRFYFGNKSPSSFTDLLVISELKWTGIGKFNSDDHYIYYCGQEFLSRNRIALRVNKSPKCHIGCSLENKRMMSTGFQSKLFKITETQIYAPSTDT